MNEALYLIIIGTISTVAGWVIISGIMFSYRVPKQFINDFKQMKSDIRELKIKFETLEEKINPVIKNE
jgi:hypothetical protein